MQKSTLVYVFFFLISFSAFAQNGLKADYYDGTNFNRLVGTKIETNIDYYWNDVAPFAEMNPHECSVRWSGRLMSPKTGKFTFSARVDDGIRVWVGGVQIIDNWQLNDVGYSTGSVQLNEGKYYDITIEYFNALLEAEIKLLWTLPKPENLSWFENFWYENKPEIIPGNYFFQPLEQKLAAEKEEKIDSPKPKEQPIKKKPTVSVKPGKRKEKVIESGS